MLSNANIEYIKEQLDVYLGESQKHQRRLLGLVTLRDKISIQKSRNQFCEVFQNFYENDSI